MTEREQFDDFHDWYQQNRKKYWVLVFLTVGFVIGLPFVILGIILEISYQNDQNEMEQNLLGNENNDEDDEFIKLEAELEFNNIKDKKSKEIHIECPVCGSKLIMMYRLPPLFLKEYVCDDCEYSGTSINKVHTKEKSKIIRNICSNCGSSNIKPHIGGITGTHYCLDCKFVGIPIIEE